jgi:hypothetical protein
MEGTGMELSVNKMVWRQFGAAIDMLADAINLCPDVLWTAAVWKDEEDPAYGQFWFVAYHTLFWIDLYLTGKSEGFKPPWPFIRGKLPEKPYTKEQIRAYLKACRNKVQATFETLTEEQARQGCTFDWFESSYLELQLYCMRHTQEHASQLNLVLGQHEVRGLDWVTEARTLKNTDDH